MAGLRQALFLAGLLLPGWLLQSAPAWAVNPPPVPAELAGIWRWVGLDAPGKATRVSAPERYLLSFPEAGRIALKADCNRAAGGASFGENGALKVGVMAMTRAMCPPGSLGDQFAEDVSLVTHWSIKDGALLLELGDGKGTMRFLPQM
ncbi:META domain-containing protein [Rhodopila sp.]|jgi:para-nitrobenzyl esterase|uniref:META domain-containing protein n=1 Tax=Rhodopila sp. TaxID=2480087 RepID=UPI002B88DF59|nr:META domain-containing protein [Rhodopila sp.]HVZ06319.1 META domain-containing protein [Rhodopila sp.]